MISPAHRANILYVGFQAVATGSFVSSDGSVYITQIFITRQLRFCGWRSGIQPRQRGKIQNKPSFIRQDQLEYARPGQTR
jgi:hypothetical protein